MLGALIGDIAGSAYENTHCHCISNSLFWSQSRMTDDSVMTAAVASAVLKGSLHDMEAFSADVKAEMLRMGKLYPRAGYGGRFLIWLNSENPQPYHSYGNGSGMRVSPVAWAAESLEQCLDLARASAIVTHDHPDGILGAETVAGAVYLAREGRSMAEIRAFVTARYPIDFTLAEIRESYEFDDTCAGSIPQAMEAFFESVDFRSAVLNAISIGGDSDTIACMAGAVAAAFYGIPKDIRTEVMKYITGEVRNIYDRFTEVY